MKMQLVDITVCPQSKEEINWNEIDFVNIGIAEWIYNHVFNAHEKKSFDFIQRIMRNSEDYKNLTIKFSVKDFVENNKFAKREMPQETDIAVFQACNDLSSKSFPLFFKDGIDVSARWINLVNIDKSTGIVTLELSHYVAKYLYYLNKTYRYLAQKSRKERTINEKAV